MLFKLGVEIMAKLNGKKVVVIGGASGVGFAVAEAALAEGGAGRRRL